MTGTDTDVGKTVVTAALVAALRAHGRSVAVYKPTQTGVSAAGEGDVDTVARLLGLRVLRHRPSGVAGPPGEDELLVAEGVRLGPPMAPVDAALLEGGQSAASALPTLAQHVARVGQLSALVDVVVVEGAGGLLVDLTVAGETVADLAVALGARLVVVTRPALGTLNHTALTLEAALRRGLTDGALVLGSWPPDPGPLHHANLTRLAELATRSGYAWAYGLQEGLGGRGPAALQAAAVQLAHVVAGQRA
ncbi:dethiobiotin synthase [Ornithinimicrobium tianjinense]|uniref:dethiobiotin synthase n=1 Tax=Ornithinimicrobium tianjinense TaxID=1195761 RepID=UPI001E3AAFE4|nr:dethiobiotin synthase [Ornithinimicrobium tianjinense]